MSPWRSNLGLLWGSDAHRNVQLVQRDSFLCQQLYWRINVDRYRAAADCKHNTHTIHIWVSLNANCHCTRFSLTQKHDTDCHEVYFHTNLQNGSKKAPTCFPFTLKDRWNLVWSERILTKVFSRGAVLIEDRDNTGPEHLQGGNVGRKDAKRTCERRDVYLFHTGFFEENLQRQTKTTRFHVELNLPHVALVTHGFSK